MGLVKFKFGTWAQYQSLSTPDNDTLYFISDKGEFYKGSKPYVGIKNATVTTVGTGENQTNVLTLTNSIGVEVTFNAVSSVALAAIKQALTQAISDVQDNLTEHEAKVATAVLSAHVKLSDSTSSTLGVSDGTAATPKAVKDALDKAKEYADSVIAANDAMVFKGTIGTGGTVTTLPSTGYKTGWTYRVITAGTYAGQKCEIGDLIICIKDYVSGSAGNSDWTVAQTNIDGAVTATSTLTANTVTLGGGGKTVKALSNGTVGQVLSIGKDGTPSWSTPMDSNTTYTFEDGTDGSFTVTPSDADPQKVSIGKPSTAGTADKVANNLKIQLNGGTTEGTSQFTFNGSQAKNVNITPANIGAAASSHNHDASNITTGTLPVTRGGTGKTTFTNGQVLIGNGTSAISQKAIDTAVTESSVNLITSGAVFSAIEDATITIGGYLEWGTIV